MASEHGADPDEPPYGEALLRQFAGLDVCVRLNDGSAWTGRLRTDLLTGRSVSVYVGDAGGEGATLYIDQIVEIVTLPQTAP